MYCVGCGAELHEKAVICPKCGVPTTNKESKPPVRKGNIIGGYIFAILMPIVGFCVGIYLLFRDHVVHGAAIIGLSVTAWVTFMQIM